MPFGKWPERLSKEYQDVLWQAQTRSTEALAAMRTVQSFAAEKTEEARLQYYMGDPSCIDFGLRKTIGPTGRRTVEGRTVLIVTHRLSTIQRAHQIVVVDNHTIVDVGSHNETLLQGPGAHQAPVHGGRSLENIAQSLL